MLPQEIIRKKRDGLKLTTGEINEFISGVASKQVSEGQIAAFCMAVLLKKMEMEERVALTSAMAKSGSVLDWAKQKLPGPVLDKHSTGGVGDKVSLMLAPIIAACGGYVPMLSGRGLGHTGGTLDKMDAIPGYRSQPDVPLFRKVVRRAGCAIIGATPDLAPADRIIYSIRDVTGTVESLDLITASILSKKLAAGLGGLVMDVKFGSGSFMRDPDNAKALAKSIVTVANGAGLPTVALLTDMNQVLGRTAGNALEVREAVEYLKNQNVDPRLHVVTKMLASEMLLIGKLAKNAAEADAKIDKALKSGQAAERFALMVAELGGPVDFMEKTDKYLKPAKIIRDFFPARKDTLATLDVFKVGIGIVELGGGRARPTDTIDHSVGLSNVARLGDAVGKGALPLATIHARDEASWSKMAKTLMDAARFGKVSAKDELVKARIVK